jgi:hypothetical protein
MDEIHPVVIVALIPLLMLFFGGILWAMKWNSDRIRRQRAVVAAAGAHAAAVPLPAPTTAAPRPVAATPPTASAAERRMPLPQWLDLVQNRLDDAPHTMIIGVTGTGKTTLVKALCATRQGQLLFVSPKPNAWPGLTYPTIDDDGGFTAIERAMQAVLAELQQRLAAMKRGTDPATFTTLTIVVDEFPTIADECATAPLLYRKLGQIGRELRLRLIPLSTTRLVKDLGLAGRGAARENFAEITLSRATARVAGLLQLAVDEPPIPIDLTGVYALSQQPIEPTRWWSAPTGAPELSGDAPATPTWTAEHVRVAAWLATEPSISTREIARRLWPDKDSGGDTSRKAKAIREAVEQVLAVSCAPVSTPPHSSVEGSITTSRLTATA